jgi:NADH-quinone oxidoreductase subunit L
VDLLWLIPSLPLLGSLVCAVLHLRAISAGARDTHGDDAAHGATHGEAHDGKHGAHPSGSSLLAPLVACAAVAGSLVVSLVGFAELRGGAERLASTPWRWIAAGAFEVDIAMVLDPLSSVMTLVVTFVGLLIHIYSIGYMRGDAGYAKFFAFLNLFVAAMLMLVLSSSLLGLFIGWEGVGLCSYLLIGFWYEKGWPAQAAQKAFVVNRIGDACFLVGSFLLVDLFGTLDLAAICSGTAHLGELAHDSRLGWAALLLFAGACGKSAQIPLFVWLPDAMAGPTPVSALIHAATMVTSGIYLIVRLNPLYALTQQVLALIACVGAATALVGATSALFQRDIKKVLAYSTVSQLGYMFLGLGVGAFAGAIFHLVTHAFFKGLLFLGAGSVIHAAHHEQDMLKLGGLKRHLPATHKTFLAGAAALSGLPLLSGFFSKDEILAAVFAHGGWYYALWALGIATAAVTALYTWRMVALTFEGPERFASHGIHPHESPPVMTVPLAILAVLSVAGGLLGLPAVLGQTHWLAHWLHPVTEAGTELLHGHHHLPHATEWVLLGLGSAVALFFAHRGFHLYRAGDEFDREVERARPELFGFLRDAWRIDSIFTTRIVQPIVLTAFVVAVVIDQFVVDGVVNGTATAVRAVAARARAIANGDVRSYALWIGTGAAAMALLWMWS